MYSSVGEVPQEPGEVSAFFQDHFDFAAQSAKEIADVFR
jgi:hypothetical protein